MSASAELCPHLSQFIRTRTEAEGPADKRINALVAIYRQAGCGLDHCEGNLLENHPDLLQNCGHCSKSWRASTLTFPHVVHQCSRDLILRGDIATNSRRKQDIV